MAAGGACEEFLNVGCNEELQINRSLIKTARWELPGTIWSLRESSDDRRFRTGVATFYTTWRQLKAHHVLFYSSTPSPENISPRRFRLEAIRQQRARVRKLNILRQWKSTTAAAGGFDSTHTRLNRRGEVERRCSSEIKASEGFCVQKVQHEATLNISINQSINQSISVLLAEIFKSSSIFGEKFHSELSLVFISRLSDSLRSSWLRYRLLNDTKRDVLTKGHIPHTRVESRLRVYPRVFSCVITGWLTVMRSAPQKLKFDIEWRDVFQYWKGTRQFGRSPPLVSVTVR